MISCLYLYERYRKQNMCYVFSKHVLVLGYIAKIGIVLYSVIFRTFFDGNTWKHINSKKNCATRTLSALWFVYEDAISAYLAKFIFINGWWQSLPKVSLTMQNVTKISKLLFWNVNGIILSIICLNFLVTTSPILCKRRIVY